MRRRTVGSAFPWSPRLAAALFIAAALAAGCSKSKAATAGGGGFQMPPTQVETAVASRGTVTERLEAVGSVEAAKAVAVTTEIDGVVKEVPLAEGQPIKEGGLIARMDDAQLKAELDRAIALRDQSGASFKRVETIVERAAGAPQDLDDARAALKVAEANVAVAQARYDKTRITAPFSGVVGARQVSPGQFVRSGDPIVELADLSRIRVRFSAPERYLAELRRGAEVNVSASAYPGLELRGTIQSVEPILDPGTRSAGVLAVVPNDGEKLRPGMSVNVSAVLAERENALTVPSEAVFFEGDQALVYAVKPDMSVARTALTLGTRMPATVEVLAGLDAGTTVVRAGHQKLYDGAKVMPAGAR